MRATPPEITLLGEFRVTAPLPVLSVKTSLPEPEEVIAFEKIVEFPEALIVLFDEPVSVIGAVIVEFDVASSVPPATVIGELPEPFESELVEPAPIAVDSNLRSQIVVLPFSNSRDHLYPPKFPVSDEELILLAVKPLKTPVNV